MTKVMEEIFEVNFNEDIKDMDISGFNQDTSSTLAPHSYSLKTIIG